MKILLVDDHPIMRQGLRSLLERNGDFEVVGEADSGAGALEQVARLQPQVVVMDVAMKDLSGSEATSRITSTWPDIRVVALSVYDRPDRVEAMLHSGASAYVVKANAYVELPAAIRAVAGGARYLSPEIADPGIDTATCRPPASPQLADLAEREQEILRSIGEGASAQDIAAQLGISMLAVEAHRRNIARKLGLDDPADLARYAARSGIASGQGP